ncbi:hypothetical protein HDU76_000475 [Blyttiomyces sp. JEL0837]|nr:hypothetical protein HDU76_000475 [Blyttiomyces sp. JEL0837]
MSSTAPHKRKASSSCPDEKTTKSTKLHHDDEGIDEASGKCDGEEMEGVIDWDKFEFGYGDTDVVLVQGGGNEKESYEKAYA